MEKKDVDWIIVIYGLIVISLSVFIGLGFLTPYLPENIIMPIWTFISYIIIIAGIAAILGLFVIGCILIVKGIKGEIK